MKRFSFHKINVPKVEVYYDKKTSTQVTETTNMLRYESKHFRCKVMIDFLESRADRHWSVGLIQACDYMHLENCYGNHGSSFWQFHPLQSKRHHMVNDSDGRQYPFYSLHSSKCEIFPGKIDDTRVTLQFEDHFYPTVAWELPHCSFGSSLTSITRKQSFWIWLVAIKRAKQSDIIFEQFNPNIDKVYVLKTMRWQYNLNLTFDSTRPVGVRLQNIEDDPECLPQVLNDPKPIPISALTPPHCNAAQSLIWYPNDKNQRTRILVPPKQGIVPWEMWCGDMSQEDNSSPLRNHQPKKYMLVGQWNRDKLLGLTNNKEQQHRDK